MIKNILKIILFTVVFCSCTEDKKLDPEENYEELFPWEGIDNVEGVYEDMDVRPCNAGEILSDYKYPGKDITNKRIYNVVIECSFKEGNSQGSRYRFRFINENKEIVALGTKSTQKDISYVLKSGEVYTKTFKVKSGYPMYLLVNGGGTNDSSVKAKITAVSEDGLITVPILETEVFQTKRGFHPVLNPYCHFIILP